MNKFLLLIILFCFPCVAYSNNFGELIVKKSNLFKNQNRWKFGNDENRNFVQLLPSQISYCEVPIIGDLPQIENVMVQITVEGQTIDGKFRAAVGGYGSNSKIIKATESGDNLVRLIFSMEKLKSHLQGNKVMMMFQNHSKGVSPRIVKIEFQTPSQKEAKDLYLEYVKKNTMNAYALSKKPGFQYVGSYDNKIKVKTSAVNLKKGLIPFVRNYMIPVYPESIPTKAERVSKVSLRMSRGESEPTQIGISALRDFKNLCLKVIGKLPKGLKVTTRWIECVPLRTKGGTSSKKWHIGPNRLWPESVFPFVDVKKNNTQAWIVEFESSESIEPGKYKIQIDLLQGSKKINRFDYNLEILPIVLKKKIKSAFGFYIQNRVDLKNIKALERAGCNSASAWPIFCPMKNGKIDFTEWDEYFRLLKEHGIDHSFLWYVGTKKSGFQSLAKVGGEANFKTILKEINKKVKSGLYPKNFYITIDEAIKNKKAFAELKTLASWMKAVSPDLKPFGVSLNRHDLALQHKGFIDMLSCNGDFERNTKWTVKEKYKLYTYGSFNARMKAFSCRFNAGFSPWRFDSDGTFAWAYNWNNGNSFNDMDSWGSDWIMVFPNWIGAPIESPAILGWREGIDDRRYLEVYESLVQKGKASKDLLIKLKAFIKADYHSEETVVGDSEFKAVINDFEKMTKARSMIIEAILKATQ